MRFPLCWSNGTSPHVICSRAEYWKAAWLLSQNEQCTIDWARFFYQLFMVSNCYSVGCGPPPPPPPISLSLSSLSPLFSIHLSSPFFPADPDRSRQMAESGSARGFFQLIREFFLSTVSKVLLIVGFRVLTFKVKCLEIMCMMIWLHTNKTELNWIESNLRLSPKRTQCGESVSFCPSVSRAV